MELTREPGFLAAVGIRREGVCHPIARTLLAAALTPDQAVHLTRAQLRYLLKKAGRKNTLGTEADRLHTALRLPQMRQLPLVEQAMGHQTIALLRQLEAACTSADYLAEAAVESLRSTRTPRSSPASQGSALSAAPGCSPRSATTDPASPTQVA